MEQQIINQVNLAMTAHNEISSVKCYVDPAQNVLATNKVVIVLKIIPVGYSSTNDCLWKELIILEYTRIFKS
ncbi:MAG: hypothetical protein H0X33_07115 [Taibaiella sp.]|nr:hypothetical protein [Taibaiella sp.]